MENFPASIIIQLHRTTLTRPSRIFHKMNTSAEAIIIHGVIIYPRQVPMLIFLVWKMVSITKDSSGNRVPMFFQELFIRLIMSIRRFLRLVMEAQLMFINNIWLIKHLEQLIILIQLWGIHQLE